MNWAYIPHPTLLRSQEQELRWLCYVLQQFTTTLKHFPFKGHRSKLSKMSICHDDFCLKTKNWPSDIENEEIKWHWRHTFVVVVPTFIPNENLHPDDSVSFLLNRAKPTKNIYHSHYIVATFIYDRNFISDLALLSLFIHANTLMSNGKTSAVLQITINLQ